MVVGSFVNVCADRIPVGEDIVKTPSHCPRCNRRLTARELVPVLSWLFLRGRCRGCGTKIPAQYPLMELANATLWALCAWRLETIPLIAVGCLATSVLLLIAVIDAKTGEIPFGCNIALAVAGAANVFVSGNIPEHVLGAFAASVPMLLVYLLSKGRAIGGGDVKFLCAAGLLLGWKSVILGFVTACVLGSVVHLARMKLGGAGRVLRLGPYLAAGAALALLFGDAAIAWYISLF
ncbi:type 4 prepilin-like proteins leader peptide-processing enzyme [Clostridia bacterium]|nr:type 4 prepilin-like proteins leader peptide-processing enzyme [Clostridia bacterium]